MTDPNDIKNKTIFDKHREKFKNEIDYHRYWKDLYEKERKLHQETEGRLKAEIEVFKFKNEQLHMYNDRMTDSNFELRREIQMLKKQIMEVTDDNKKLAMQITELTNRLRDADF